MTETKIVTVTRDYAATPERVFDAWLDKEAIGRFLFRTPDGELSKVEIDARVGGTFQVDEQRGEMLAQHFGEYVEIDRPHRLAFKFRADPGAEWTLVTIEIEPSESGSRLTLTHEGVWADYEERTQKGWGMIMDELAKVVE
jgi:uncharacterized protein YndB with AHSA1/START domain